MAAGLGFKTFTTGEVLTAADTNGYLMQGVLVFASAAARNAAITSPQEGQFAYTKDTNGLWYYDGAAWVASGATGDIEGVTAGVGISGGGTSGTVTVTNSMATAIDAKGDLVPGTGADTFARLAVGTNGQVLQADSTAATGLKWATPAASGLTKVQSSTFTSVANTGTTLDGIFTNAYKKYIVQLDFFEAVTYDADLQMQIYESGTLYADYYYGVTQGWDYSGGLLTAATNSRTALLTVWTKCSGLSASLTFFGVGNAATQPQWQGTLGQVQNTETMLCGGNVATNRSTTGLYFKVATGNFSGTVTVYGLAN